MAQNIQPRLTPPVAIPQHYVPPTARELRAQGVHRLQVGLFGLAAMLLLVGLANIIMDRARLSDDAANAEETAMGVQSTGKAASDPLADIGVVPQADPSGAAAAKAGR
jgi:hypothetical protein